MHRFNSGSSWREVIEPSLCSSTRELGGCSRDVGVAPMVSELLPEFLSAPRIFELLPGFWSKIWKIYLTFYEKCFKKGTLNQKIEKKCSTIPFLLSLSRYWHEKKSHVSVQVAFSDHIVLISQTDDICFSLYIKHYW